MNKLYNELERIKSDIRTINPNISDELLDLLHEYFVVRQSIDINENVVSVKDKNGVSWLVDKRSKLYFSIKNS